MILDPGSVCPIQRGHPLCLAISSNSLSRERLRWLTSRLLAGTEIGNLENLDESQNGFGSGRGERLWKRGENPSNGESVAMSMVFSSFSEAFTTSRTDSILPRRCNSPSSPFTDLPHSPPFFTPESFGRTARMIRTTKGTNGQYVWDSLAPWD